MRDIFQSQAENVMVLMVDSSDSKTGATGKTLTITISKNGGAFSSVSPDVTDRGNGWYLVELDSNMTNTLKELIIHATASGCDPYDEKLNVVPAVGDYPQVNVYSLEDSPALDDIEARVDASNCGTAVAAIQAKTDNLPTDPASASAITAAFTQIKGSGWTSTDTLEGIFNAISDIDITNTIYPIAAQIDSGNETCQCDRDLQLEAAQYDTKTWSLSFYNADWSAYDFSGMTLRLVFEPVDSATDSEVIEDADITVVDNILTFTTEGANSTLITKNWELQKVISATQKMRLFGGLYVVGPGVKKDS